VLGARILFILYFRTYAGIIRHTSLQDAIKVFYAISASSFLILAISFGYSYITAHEQTLLPLSVIIIDYIFATLLMNAFRLSVKVLYMRINRPSADSVVRVAIFGADESGIITKRKLEQQPNGKMKVVAFFDDDSKRIKNYVDGVTIYDAQREMEQVMQELDVHELVISSQKISKTRKQELIELAMNAEVRVRNVPPVDRWINGELSVNQIKGIKIEDLLERDEIVLDKGAIAQKFFNKTIMITGAAGSIGSEIARQILNSFSPKKLVLVDKSEVQLYELDSELAIQYKKAYNSSIEIVVADVTVEPRMRKVFKTYKPDFVFHAAAYKHVPLMEDNPSESIRVNVGGTKIVADLSVEFKVDKFVFVSTDKAVNPTNVMGASKRIAEIYIQSLNHHLLTNPKTVTKFITTRFGNVLGSSGSVIPKFRKQIEEGGPVTVTHPEVTRYFMTIPEACQLVLEAGNMGNGGEIYIFDMGKSMRILDLARKMIQLSGLKIGEDIQIVFSGLRPGEKLTEELLADQENTVPTYHPKIMIAKVRLYEFDWVNAQIEEIIGLYDEQNNEKLVMKMKSIVPEFISQNSIFEALDYKEVTSREGILHSRAQ
jgi:FlaA1/EpsC-like NDP-sugar epimerase